MREAKPDRAALWRDTNFRWLCGGSAVSMVGDQFTLIALPWLVLKLTHDPLALGGVLAAMNAPRAVFMLIGGALADRAAPRGVLLVTRWSCAILLALLGALVLAQRIDTLAVTLLAAALGLATAFAYPAASALLPSVLAADLLPGANGVLMGMRQVTTLAGPLVAGGLIAALGAADAHAGGTGLADARGLGVAFLLDAASFVVSTATLARVRPRAQAPAPAQRPALFASLAAGLRYCWDDARLRASFLYWGALAFLVSGPLSVALPLLATRLGGAGTYGSLMAAHGAGTLAGMLLSGARPGLRVGSFGTTLLTVDGIVGVLFMLLAGVGALWQGAALLLVLGVLGGYLQVAVMTWLQRAIRPDMLGRGMALLLFLFTALMPLSAALSGAIARAAGLAPVFVGFGLATLAVVAVGLVTTPIRRLTET